MVYCPVDRQSPYPKGGTPHMELSYFFGAAAGGFLLMAAVGIQALIALFSSIPLAKRRKKECPGFDLQRAFRRITVTSVSAVVLVVAITIAVIHFTSMAPTAGYLFGMILGFVLSIKRMTPNNAENQKRFESIYADCYPSGHKD